MFYAELFTEQFTEELKEICDNLFSTTCISLNLVLPWTTQAVSTPRKCKCAPYYAFDTTSKSCVPIKNRLPHCVAGAELIETFDDNLKVDFVSDICVLCEPGYV